MQKGRKWKIETENEKSEMGRKLMALNGLKNSFIFIFHICFGKSAILTFLMTGN
jgi:hypothetical protein